MSESTQAKIAQGRAMLNTIDAHMNTWPLEVTHGIDEESICDLREMYDRAERAYERGLITDPHPRQVGTRILPRWEWWLHRIALRFGLGRAES